MDYFLIAVVVFFVILISIQYTLNKMIVLLKEIRDLLYKLNSKDRI
ncbi:MAG: hypothetical protein ACOYVK_12270 [Bacillota bacterium]